MKFMPGEISRTLKEILKQAHEAETNADVKSAISLYEEAIAVSPLNEVPYNRLMVIYRRLKQYKEELNIIKKGIKVYEEFYDSKIPNKSKTITALSNKLNKSVGLSDKKEIPSITRSQLPDGKKEKWLLKGK